MIGFEKYEGQAVHSDGDVKDDFCILYAAKSL